MNYRAHRNSLLSISGILLICSQASAGVDIPTAPTNIPTVPTVLPTVPTTNPSVPTNNPSVPAEIPVPPIAKLYTFTGFRAPVVNNGITNTTKGRNIRIGWNLTDTSGALITNPAVVADRFYKEIDCNTNTPLSGANPAGIRLTRTIWNKGRKDLEFSWKVPNLAKSCLLFTIVFDDAQTATAKFYVK